MQTVFELLLMFINISSFMEASQSPHTHAHTHTPTAETQKIKRKETTFANTESHQVAKGEGNKGITK